jgi:hypothetical protein
MKYGFLGVGESVGSPVGAGVGESDGFAVVGLGVGEAEGDALGSGVSPLQLKLSHPDRLRGTTGDFVGSDVGFDVGELDGGSVGFLVGSADGSEVGSEDGSFVGDTDGEGVGLMVGLAMTVLMIGSDRTGLFAENELVDELVDEVDVMIISDKLGLRRAESPTDSSGSKMGSSLFVSSLLILRAPSTSRTIVGTIGLLGSATVTSEVLSSVGTLG